MTETDTLPAAIVVSIDDRNLEYTRVRVRCPFCAEVHTHGMPDDDGDDGERVPHCGYPHSRPDGPYRITFDGDPVRESTLAPVCGVLQCDNPVTRHFDICVVCNACDELVTGIGDAVLTFLNDRLPVPRKGRWAGSSEDDSEDGEGVYDRESSVRQEIMTAGGDIAHGVARLLEIAVGKRVYITYGPAPDPYDRWYGALGWGISEDQEPTR